MDGPGPATLKQLLLPCAELKHSIRVDYNGEVQVIQYQKYYKTIDPEFEAVPTDPLSIAELLICPGCKKIAVPPIYNCYRGHSVCSLCWTKRKYCPVSQCTYSQTTSRNWAIEKIFTASEFDCFYECGKTGMLGDALVEHLKVCEKNPKPQEKQSQISKIDKQIVTNQDMVPSIPKTRVLTKSLAIWVPCRDGEIPERAVYGGAVRMRAGGPMEKIYIIRARHSNQLYGGRLIVSEGAAHIYAPIPSTVTDPRGYADDYEFRPYRKAYYEVLTLNPSVKIRWEDLSGPPYSPPENAFLNEGWIGIEPAYITRMKIEVPYLGIGSNKKHVNRRQAERQRNGPCYLYIPGVYASSLGCIIGQPDKPRSKTLVQYSNVQFLVVDS